MNLYVRKSGKTVGKCSVFNGERCERMKNKILKIGHKTIEQVESTLRYYGKFTKILYVADPYVDKLYGSIVRAQIENVGRMKEELVDDNTIQYAMDIAGRILATDIDCVVGIGGGKALDVAKFAASIAKKPLLSIPTTLAHDGIVSPIAVLKRLDDKPKSLGCTMPSMIILDTDIVATCPPELIKAGIGDTISNYMALKDWDFAVARGKEDSNGYAYMLSQTSLNSLMRSPYSKICPELIDVLANSLILSGIAMDFAGSSRPVSGSEHLFSHALDFYGEQNSLHGYNVALGTVAVLKIIGEDCSEVINYLKKYDVDVNPVRMNISESLFIECMQKATGMRNNRYTYLHEADLNTKKLSRVYHELVEEL